MNSSQLMGDTAGLRDVDAILSKKTICLATFAVRWRGKLVGRTIYPTEVLQYLKPRTGRLYYIEQPMNSAADRTPSMEVYELGELRGRYTLKMPNALLTPPADLTTTSIPLKFRDIYAVVSFLVGSHDEVDLFIAMEGINALTGVALKRLGIVRKVAYCVMDYMPRRFENPFLNAMFHAIDRLCMRTCDFAWNVSPNVEQARRKYDRFNGGARQVIVPVPAPKPDPGLLGSKKEGILYLGLLYPNLGADLLLRAFAKVLARLPWAKLDIVGDGPLKQALVEYVKNNELEKSVTIHGMLEDQDADRLVASARIGAAPYVISDGNSQFVYMDSSKAKLYLAYGLPIVITRTAAPAKQIVQRGAGLGVDCTEESLAEALVKLLTDDALCDRMHRNALALGSELLPESVFRSPFALAFAS